MFRNQPFLLLVNDASDYTVLGLDTEQAQQIADNQWAVVNAPRPLPSVYQDDAGTYHTGIAWEAVGVLNAWFFAAGNPEGNMPNGKTLADSWNSNDAYPVCLVTEADLEQMVRTRLENRDYDADEAIQIYKEMEGDKWLVTVANQLELGAAVWDKRS